MGLRQRWSTRGFALRISALALLSLVGSVIAPQQAAVSQTPRLSQAACTLLTPEITGAQGIIYVIDIDAEVKGEGTCDLEGAIEWQFQNAELPASPTNEECKSGKVWTIKGPKSNNAKINFRSNHPLKILTYYGFRVGVKWKGTDDSTLWSSGCTSARVVPHRPTSPEALAFDGQDSSVVLYNAKTSAGGCSLENWQYRYKKASETDWGDWVSVGLNNNAHLRMPRVVVSGLENGTRYNFQVRALNCGGEEFAGRVSSTITSIPRASSPPDNTQPNNPPIINIPPTGSTPGGASGSQPPDESASRNRFVDDDGSIHEADINLLALNGITEGCDRGSDRFCPDDVVTRAQMATFLARAMSLKPPEDPQAWRFQDTVGHFHEPGIRAIAAKGITRGCNPEGTLFCPDDWITRAQTAAFLARALELETPADPSAGAFEDIAGHVHEDSIRAIAAKGITRGCNPEGTLFCPDDWITRAQMAAFLVRAFNLQASSI